MSEEPATYRSGTAGFDYHVGSAFKAILPGAFQGSVVGSVGVALYTVYNLAVSGEYSGASDFLSALMTFLAVGIGATMLGMVICSIFIALIGFPLAVLLKRRIATRGALILATLVAGVVALVLSVPLTDAVWAKGTDAWLLPVAALAYAIPAAIAYRRAIITERMLSFWSANEA